MDEVLGVGRLCGDGTKLVIGERLDVLDVPDPYGPYGPLAFVLSGFSEVTYDFNGGPGIVGIHGTNDPEALGTRVSHGCIRIRNDVIEDLAEFLPVGTPVNVT